MKKYTQLKGKTGGEGKGNTSTLSSSLIRYETLADRDYLVSPVVLIVGDIVVQGANAENPELVTLECLENSHLKGFDGRPIVPGHPYNGKDYTSANLPEVFNNQQCGMLFHTGLNGKNLGSEIYLDIERCTSLGGDANNSLTALQEGRSIDVSIGVYFESIEEHGELNGQEYSSVWTEIWADHLALLPNGEGACNQNMGCGTPRVASSRVYLSLVSDYITSQLYEIRTLRRHIR